MLHHPIAAFGVLLAAISSAHADNYELIAFRAANPNPHLVINEVVLIDHIKHKIYNCSAEVKDQVDISTKCIDLSYFHTLLTDSDRVVIGFNPQCHLRLLLMNWMDLADRY